MTQVHYPGLSPPAIEKLRNFSPPGNILWRAVIETPNQEYKLKSGSFDYLRDSLLPTDCHNMNTLADTPESID